MIVGEQVHPEEPIEAVLIEGEVALDTRAEMNNRKCQHAIHVKTQTIFLGIVQGTQGTIEEEEIEEIEVVTPLHIIVEVVTTQRHIGEITVALGGEADITPDMMIRNLRERRALSER